LKDLTGNGKLLPCHSILNLHYLLKLHQGRGFLHKGVGRKICMLKNKEQWSETPSRWQQGIKGRSPSAGQFLQFFLNNKNLRLNGHTSFESQTRNYITCFGHISNHRHSQENYTQKYINMVLITV